MVIMHRIMWIFIMLIPLIIRTDLVGEMLIVARIVKMIPGISMMEAMVWVVRVSVHLLMI